mmetsp:Transcript_443/g.1239  ORF Transcript_443/g.1239 Transcript_443/m.1239 type:complete len:233 (+) Transcript_443:1836-2534(+)
MDATSSSIWPFHTASNMPRTAVHSATRARTLPHASSNSASVTNPSWPTMTFRLFLTVSRRPFSPQNCGAPSSPCLWSASTAQHREMSSASIPLFSSEDFIVGLALNADCRTSPVETCTSSFPSASPAFFDIPPNCRSLARYVSLLPVLATTTPTPSARRRTSRHVLALPASTAALSTSVCGPASTRSDLASRVTVMATPSAGFVSGSHVPSSTSRPIHRTVSWRTVAPSMRQ